jgi:hypothetical protein
MDYDPHYRLGNITSHYERKLRELRAKHKQRLESYLHLLNCILHDYDGGCILQEEAQHLVELQSLITKALRKRKEAKDGN